MTKNTKEPYKNTKAVKENNLQEKGLTEEITAVLEDIKDEPAKEKKKGEEVIIIDETNIMIGQREYNLVKNHREAFDSERLGERFSDVLSRYDYIVGDWGYDQLRLKGFFNKTNRKATPEQRIDTLEDYLYEYCNFGCAYFVLERIGNIPEKQQNRRKRTNRKANPQPKKAYIDEKRSSVTSKSKTVIKNRQEAKPKDASNEKTAQVTKGNEKRSFRIRQREEQS